MNIQVTSRHSKVSQETKDYLTSELESLEKYYDKMTSCHVVLDSEHISKTVEILVNVLGTSVTAKAKAENLGKAVDLALSKITRQLKKFNEKLKNHKTVKTPKVVYEESISE